MDIVRTSLLLLLSYRPTATSFVNFDVILDKSFYLIQGQVKPPLHVETFS